MEFLLKNGLLPTPNGPKLHSPKAQDYVKRSYFPIPFQAVNIIESFNIQSKPTWDINVTSKALKFKAEWDIVKQNLLNNPTDIFSRSIIETIGTYSLVNSAWSTSFNGQKLCIKLEWKIQNTDLTIHDSPIYNTSHTPFTPGFLNSPINHSFVSTPTKFSSLKSPPDSGYKSQSDSYKNPSKYYSNWSRNLNIESNTENSPLPHANLFNSPCSPVNRQDLQRLGSRHLQYLLVSKHFHQSRSLPSCLTDHAAM